MLAPIGRRSSLRMVADLVGFAGMIASVSIAPGQALIEACHSRLPIRFENLGFLRHMEFSGATGGGAGDRGGGVTRRPDGVPDRWPCRPDCGRCRRKC